MKKIILLSFLAVSATMGFSQITTPPDTTKKDFKHLIGVDATALIGQFLNLNEYWYYYDPYLATYKKFCGSNAMRAGIGGNYSNTDETEDDTISTSQTRADIRIGIGFEHYTYINKKCNLYFGADIIYKHTSFTSLRDYSLYTADSDDKSNSIGISPLLGFQFKFWKRISLAVETNLDILYTKYDKKHEVTYSDENSPYEDVSRNTERTGFSTFITPPIAIRFQAHF